MLYCLIQKYTNISKCYTTNIKLQDVDKEGVSQDCLRLAEILNITKFQNLTDRKSSTKNPTQISKPSNKN